MSEEILWQSLRRRQLCNAKFLRQHPIIYESLDNQHWFYIPDFYCAEKKLVIELDGHVHDYQKDSDEQRDKVLSEMGLRILRFNNEELLKIQDVLKRIEEVLISSS
jgi:very-short-patch-repair endonuclease